MLAIGDAAFSHDPIGGRGLSFAVGSVFAAGAVLQTWRDQPARWQCAVAYYADYVAAEKQRHLAFISGDQKQAPQPQPVPSHVVWSGKEARAPLALEDGIDVADVALTQAGTPVRWLGCFETGFCAQQVRAFKRQLKPYGHAAIDRKVYACDEACFVRRKEQGGRRDLLRAAPASFRLNLGSALHPRSARRAPAAGR